MLVPKDYQMPALRLDQGSTPAMHSILKSLLAGTSQKIREE